MILVKDKSKRNHIFDKFILIIYKMRDNKYV